MSRKSCCKAFFSDWRVAQLRGRECRDPTADRRQKADRCREPTQLRPVATVFSEFDTASIAVLISPNRSEAVAAWVENVPTIGCPTLVQFIDTISGDARLPPPTCAASEAAPLMVVCASVETFCASDGGKLGRRDVTALRVRDMSRNLGNDIGRSRSSPWSTHRPKTILPVTWAAFTSMFDLRRRSRMKEFATVSAPKINVVVWLLWVRCRSARSAPKRYGTPPSRPDRRQALRSHWTLVGNEIDVAVDRGRSRHMRRIDGLERGGQPIDGCGVIPREIGGRGRLNLPDRTPKSSKLAKRPVDDRRAGHSAPRTHPACSRHRRAL